MNKPRAAVVVFLINGTLWLYRIAIMSLYMLCRGKDTTTFFRGTYLFTGI
jgi:hypothetical protein